MVKKKGRPEGTTIPLEIRFWKRVDKTPGHGPWGDCWLWTGGKAGKGYGVCGIHVAYGKPHKQQYAHRISFELAHGSIPDDLNCLHRCDNPACVNPSHLFLGTQLENMEDMRNKGRSRPREKSHKAKITQETANYIRQRRRDGLSYRAIAKEVSLCTQHVCDIDHGKYWNPPSLKE